MRYLAFRSCELFQCGQRHAHAFERQQREWNHRQQPTREHEVAADADDGVRYWAAVGLNAAGKEEAAAALDNRPELAALKAEMNAIGPRADDPTPAYLAAARRVIASPKFGGSDDILFDDFEGDRYDTSVGAAVVEAKWFPHLPIYRQQDQFAGSGWTPATRPNIPFARLRLVC